MRLPVTTCVRRGLPGLLIMASLAVPPGAAPAREGQDDDPTRAEAEALLERVDDLYRGESSRATATMQVVTDRYERTLKMRTLSEGTDKALVRILEPAKERGVTTLKVDDNLWNYLPKVDRTIKVPAAMMSNAWMGSHFTNDDLVQESRMSEDYEARVESRPDAEPKGKWVLELTPKPDAPVVWGEVRVVIDAGTELPEEATYYDEQGELVRTLTWSDVKSLAGRKLPTTMKVVPADDPGEYTRINYQDLEFDVDHPPGTFSLQSLRR